LANLLTHNKALTSIDIGSNAMGVEGIGMLCEALKDNRTLLEFDTGSNDLGEKGGQHLIKLLEYNSFLQKIACSQNGMTDVMMKKIEQSTTNNQYYTRIRQNDKKLILVDWDGKPEGIIGARLLSQALEKNNTLKAINAPSNQFFSQGCKCLADILPNNSSLTFLNLEKNNVRPEGATHLAEALKTNNMLTDLNLKRNGAIGDEGAMALAGKKSKKSKKSKKRPT
jgi:Ran GTPase-activating protein (RanGAP) involved in mRNA processing and transport